MVFTHPMQVLHHLCVCENLFKTYFHTSQSCLSSDCTMKTFYCMFQYLLCICLLSYVCLRNIEALEVSPSQQDTCSWVVCLFKSKKLRCLCFLPVVLTKTKCNDYPGQLNWPHPMLTLTTHSIPHIPFSHSAILPHDNTLCFPIKSHEERHIKMLCWLGCGFAWSGLSTSEEHCGKPLESLCPPCRYISHYGVGVWCHRHNTERRATHKNQWRSNSVQ